MAAPAVNTWTYFDHDADIGVTGRGKTLEAAFVAAAEGMFSIMADLPAVVADVAVSIEFVEADPEYALVAWLNALLAQARARGMVFSRFDLHRQGACWCGEAWGEPWRPDLERGTEVKGATLTMLSVQQRGGTWEARCVVDV